MPVNELDYRKEKSLPPKPGPNPQHYTPLMSLSIDDVEAIQKDLRKVSHYLCINVESIFSKLSIHTLVLLLVATPNYRERPPSLTWPQFLGKWVGLIRGFDCCTSIMNIYM